MAITCMLLFAQARLVLEEPDTVEHILQDWQKLLPATLAKWDVQQQDLQVFFENFRNDLLQNKEASNDTAFP